jgi:hypothetical protein
MGVGAMYEACARFTLGLGVNLLDNHLGKRITTAASNLQRCCCFTVRLLPAVQSHAQLNMSM